MPPVHPLMPRTQTPMLHKRRKRYLSPYAKECVKFIEKWIDDRRTNVLSDKLGDIPYYPTSFTSMDNNKSMRTNDSRRVFHNCTFNINYVFCLYFVIFFYFLNFKFFEFFGLLFFLFYFHFFCRSRLRLYLIQSVASLHFFLFFLNFSCVYKT